MEYLEFLKNKKKTIIESGFICDEKLLNKNLFDFQKHIVIRALKMGRFAIFADCGLGKTLMQLSWAEQVVKKTKGKVLILAPLAVKAQTKNEALKFGIDLFNIEINNYEQLDNINASDYAGIVLDESSILKNFTGKYKKQIIEMFENTPYKLACTATPSPNDLNEIGNHSEFLNVLDAQDMRAKWFVRDEGMNNYRLKGHAKKDFYGWISSWAVMLTNPKDLGFDGSKYILPQLKYYESMIETKSRDNGKLFNEGSVSATDFNKELKLTKVERLDEVARIINSSKENFIIWVKQNNEGETLKKMIPDAIEISGSDSLERKNFLSLWFSNQNNECQCQTTNSKEEKANINQSIGLNTMPNTKTKSTQKQINVLKKNESQIRISENSESNIASSTTQIIKTSLISEHQNRQKNVMPKEGSDMLTMRNTENVKNNAQTRQGNMEMSELITTCESNMELHSKNIMQCLNNNNQDVQYAELNHHSSNQNNDSTLTIATKQEKSEDCSAQTAIKDLESLMIARYCSNVPLCTYCGKHKRKVLISKTKILSFGMNFQNCNNQIFASLDFSFEGLYQAIRRSYRFGQKKDVNIYIITTDTMENVMKSIENKQKQFLEMQNEMNKFINGDSFGLLDSYEFKEVKNDKYWLMKGDSCQEIKRIPDNSVDLIVFSPPFSSLFTYSNYIHDMGNNDNHEEFFKQYEYLLKDLYRILKPGRLMVCHTKDLAVYKNSSGYTGLYDFTGEHHRAVEKVGFKYHSKINIWTDPVLEMQRTKTQRLLYKQLRKDSTYTGVGLPEYCTIFRKWEGNEEDWTPVNNKNASNFPLDVWQSWASPTWNVEKKDIEHLEEVMNDYRVATWMDIKRTDVLNNSEGTDLGDEKHIAPLQLSVIRRCVQMWSNPGETVFTPFLGIGSEIYESVKLDRFGIGIELKDKYFETAIKNINKVVESKKQLSLF